MHPQTCTPFGGRNCGAVRDSAVVQKSKAYTARPVYTNEDDGLEYSGVTAGETFSPPDFIPASPSLRFAKKPISSAKPISASNFEVHCHRICQLRARLPRRRALSRPAPLSNLIHFASHFHCGFSLHVMSCAGSPCVPRTGARR